MKQIIPELIVTFIKAALQFHSEETQTRQKRELLFEVKHS
jgi:hypothetical protein